MLMSPVVVNSYAATVYYSRKRYDADDDPYEVIVTVRGRDTDGHHYKNELRASCSEPETLLQRAISALLGASGLMSEFTAEVSVTSNNADSSATSLMLALQMHVRQFLDELNNPTTV